MWRSTWIRGACLTRFGVQPMMSGVARPSAEPPMPAGPELFAALGHRPGIGVIVDGLYDRLERDRELARHFRSRRPGERERLKQFFETIFGGERRGIRDIGAQRRHLHRLITADESARWLSHFGAAMQAAGVPVTVELVEGVAHGHLNVPGLPAALRSLAVMADFLDVS